MGNARMSAKVAPFAVDRQKAPRFRHPENVSEVRRRSVPGRVNDGILRMQDLDAFLVQCVDDAKDILLVTRYQSRRKHYQVAGMKLNGMLVAGHPRDCGERLTLGAGTNKRDVFPRRVKRRVKA